MAEYGSRWAGVACAILAMAFSGVALADDLDTAPVRFVCTFGTGTSVSYGDGTFTSKAANPLVFTITKIDLEGQSAAISTGEGMPAVTVRIVRAVNANHFLEVVTEGFLNLTTVYDKDPKTGLHPAVHSRHLGLLGVPFFGQYTGTCTE